MPAGAPAALIASFAAAAAARRRGQAPAAMAAVEPVPAPAPEVAAAPMETGETSVQGTGRRVSMHRKSRNFRPSLLPQFQPNASD
jgi:hypothetical protein